MLNSYRLNGGDINNNTTVIMNQPSTGMIQKSNPVSRFINVKKDSKEFKSLFPNSFEENPHIAIKKIKHCGYRFGMDDFYEEIVKKEVIILQCMVYGHDEFFVEYVFKDDLDGNRKDADS